MIKIDMASTTAKRAPGDFVKDMHGRPVTVRLNTGVDYKGDIDVVIFCCPILLGVHYFDEY